MGAMGVAEVVKHLPSKCEALCSNSNIVKKKTLFTEVYKNIKHGWVN
jgi:hypothetical protein